MKTQRNYYRGITLLLALAVMPNLTYASFAGRANDTEQAISTSDTAGQLKTYDAPLVLTAEISVGSEDTFQSREAAQGAAMADSEGAVSALTNSIYDVLMDTDTIILRGAWAQEGTGYVKFWVSVDGKTLGAAQLDFLSIATSRYKNWSYAQWDTHTFGAASITGRTRYKGAASYSEVQVPVQVFTSGISTLRVTAGGVNLATAYVLTPGDVVTDPGLAFGFVNTSDIAQVVRVVNRCGVTEDPLPGLANDFAFEMMDMTGDGIINTSDASALVRIVNGITHY